MGRYGLKEKFIIYLPDFDKALSSKCSKAAILEEELIYSLLFSDGVLISAASPFKNPLGWKVVNKYKVFFEEDLINFPLDSRHNGLISNYIKSRTNKLYNLFEDPFINPEYKAYNGKSTDLILDIIDHKRFTSSRPIDCDATFRGLVLKDIENNNSKSIKMILNEKKCLFGKKDFFDFVKECASSKKKPFQRFYIFENLPNTFIIDSVSKLRTQQRIDELFFEANAISAGLDTSNSLQNLDQMYQFKTFCKYYKIGSNTLDQILLSLSPYQLIQCKESQCFKDFKQEFLSKIELLENDIAQNLVLYYKKMDRKHSIGGKIGESFSHVIIAQALALILNEAQLIPYNILGPLSSFLGGVLPFVGAKITATSPKKVFEYVKFLKIR